MLNAVAQPLVKLVERYLPDPYIFVLLLSLLVFVAAIVFEQQSPLAVAQQWGDGFWGLLSFSMQMLLVLVTGFMLASTPLVSSLLDRLALLAKTAGQAIVLVTLVSLAASWLNWGFGLVVGALFAKALARRIQVDYPLLIASAYSGFVIWHGGLSGSVPLTIATSGHFAEAQIGIIPTSDTIFSSFNLLLVAALVLSVPLLNYLMRPKAEDAVYIDPAKLIPETQPDLTTERPADKLENSFVITAFITLAAVAYLLQYFAKAGGLNLNIVNFLFLFLAIFLHGTPRRLLHSLQQAIQGGAGIIIQFPFYAGIMAVMMQSGLAQSLSQWFVSFATAESLAFWTLSALV